MEGSERFVEVVVLSAAGRDGEGKPVLRDESSEAEEVSPSSSLES